MAVTLGSLLNPQAVAGAQQQAITTANRLREERTFVEINFAVTGDRRADLVSGLMAIINWSNTESRGDDYLFPEGGTLVERTLEYILQLYRDARVKAEDQERWARENTRQTWEYTKGQIMSQPPQTAPPYSMVGTTGGLGNLGQAICDSSGFDPKDQPW